ncbi:MAG: toll/interleukin-1 receptor domain-containing protein, partial [Clostridia bacterium]|nr:toll/interleukin-1 receptor domain-containing protein [Clostridia bacterium]
MNGEKLSIFLSHSHADIEKVRKLRDVLETLECEPLIFFLKCLDDDTDVLEDFIQREIENRSLFLYCKSENAEKSVWVKKELDYIRSFDKNRLYTVDI